MVASTDTVTLKHSMRTVPNSNNNRMTTKRQRWMMMQQDVQLHHTRLSQTWRNLPLISQRTNSSRSCILFWMIWQSNRGPLCLWSRSWSLFILTRMSSLNRRGKKSIPCSKRLSKSILRRSRYRMSTSKRTRWDRIWRSKSINCNRTLSRHKARYRTCPRESTIWRKRTTSISLKSRRWNKAQNTGKTHSKWLSKVISRRKKRVRLKFKVCNRRWIQQGVSSHRWRSNWTPSVKSTKNWWTSEMPWFMSERTCRP